MMSTEVGREQPSLATIEGYESDHSETAGIFVQTFSGYVSLNRYDHGRTIYASARCWL